MAKRKSKKVKKDTFQIHHLRTIVFSIGLLLVLWYMFSNPHELSTGRAIWLFAFGAIVGLIDVPRKEQNSFILASVGLMLTTAVPFHQIGFLSLGLYIKAFLMNLALFATPAVVIVALKVIFRLLQETTE